MNKLLIATDSFLPRWDGVSRFLYEIIPRLSDTFKIRVVAPKFKGKSPPLRNIEAVRIPLTCIKVGDYQLPRAVSFEITTFTKDVDLVWTHTLGPISLGISLLAKLQHKPLISYVHSIEWELFALSIPKNKILRSIVYFLTKLVARIHYNLTDLLLIPSEEVGNKLTFSGIKTPKVVIPLAVDIKKFKPPLNKAEAKEKIGIERDSIVIGYCGRLAREKDLITLKRAFQRLITKREKCKLLIIGDGLKEIKESLRKVRDAILVGNTDEAEKYYQAMDIFVLPSLTETTGLSVLEAMASGVAVISTPVGISPHIIKNGKTGYLFEMHSEYELYKLLDKLVSNRILREKIGKKSRETVEKHFSWEKTTAKIKQVLMRFAEKQ